MLLSTVSKVYYFYVEVLGILTGGGADNTHASLPLGQEGFHPEESEEDAKGRGHLSSHCHGES